jgi:undecaprenyl-diphosphatase
MVLLYAFAGLAGNVVDKQTFSFDLPAMQAVRYLESPWLTLVMQVVTVSASTWGTIVLALTLCIGLWLAGRRPEAIVLALGLVLSAALGQALKYAFVRPRPHLLPWLTVTRGWSFPSGHTLNAVTLSGLLAWLFGRRLSGWQRVALTVGVGLWAVLVGLSRIYLGVHYPSDVLASLAVGSLYLLAGRGMHRLMPPNSRVVQSRETSWP